MPLRLQVSALEDPLARTFQHEFDADRRQIVLGRRGGVDVLLPHPRVSLVHARIERQGAEYFLADEGSKNGTRLNGAAVPSGQRRTLKDGDRIVVGDFQLLVSISDKRPEWRAESSGSLARHMARELLERLGPGEAQPHLVVLDGPQGGVVLTLGELGRTWVLGRAGSGDLRLDDVDLWREQAALERDAEGVTVRELGPAAGLTINGEPLAGARRLHDGDTLIFGGTALRFVDPADIYLRKLESVPVPDEPHGDAGRARPPRAGVEIVLAVAGTVAALAAAIALVYVLAW